MANGHPTTGTDGSGYTNGNGAIKGNAHSAGANDKAHASGTSGPDGDGIATGNAYGNGKSSGNGGGSNGNGYANGALGNTARWQLMVSAAAVVTAIGGALLTLLVNINSLDNTASSLSTRVTALESVAVAGQEQRVTFRSDIASIRRDLVEIETQFCAEDSMRNLMQDNDMRLIAMLWLKTQGAELPTASAYYPHIGRCQATAQ